MYTLLYLITTLDGDAQRVRVGEEEPRLWKELLQRVVIKVENTESNVDGFAHIHSTAVMSSLNGVIDLNVG